MTQGVDIPLRIIEGNDTLVMLGRIVNALEGTGRAAASSEPKARTLGDALTSLGEKARHINEVREFVVSFAESLVHAAERVAELAAEQQRLDANSARLGLNFREAAEQAGGYVSEMQAMQLATALANRDIHVTQTELDALARVGMARARDAGKNVEEVFDSIADSVVEGGEELEKFGTSLHSVSDESHTSSERLSALAARGREVTPALRTAGDEVSRFREQIEQTQRTLASGFALEFARLSTLATPFRDANAEAEDFNRTLTAVGQTAAMMVSRIANGVGAIIGTLVTGIGVAIGALASFGAGVGAIATGNFGSVRANMERAFEDMTNDQSTTGLVAEWTRRRVAALDALADDQEQRTRATPGAAGPQPSDLTVTAAEAGIDPRTGRPIRRGGGGGGRARQRPPTMDELMQRAISGSRPEARLGEEPGLTAAQLARLQRERELAERDQSNRVEADDRAYQRSDEGIGARARKDVGNRREERELDRRYQSQLSFTERMEDLSSRRIHAAQEEAEAVSGAFNSMGRAFSDHLTAVVEGREELGTALQGMLSDTLTAISKEASVKAGLNLAEGFAALATYRFDAAAEHFTAAGIYTGVAAVSGIAGAAIAPASNDNARGSAGEASARQSASPQGAVGGSSRGETVINVAFNGPQFGTGGVVQAARELVGVLNAGAVQGGVQINRLAVSMGR